MKQQVDITLKLTLWIDASLSRDEIAGLAPARLAEALAGETRDGVTPITILSLQEEAEIYGCDLPTRFDNYEIHGVRESGDDNDKCCEQVPDEEARFWRLYGHIPGQGLDCIGDFSTRGHAEEVFVRITGRPYESVSLSLSMKSTSRGCP